jgi:hypothetical protein
VINICAADQEFKVVPSGSQKVIMVYDPGTLDLSVIWALNCSECQNHLPAQKKLHCIEFCLPKIIDATDSIYCY